MKKMINLALALFLIMGCSSKENSLNLSLRSLPTSIDPVKAFDKPSLEILGNSYEPLFQYHYLLRPHKVIPLLAKEFPQISGDGLTYKIKIKDNVFYHSHPLIGEKRKVVAKDFINQIKRLAFQPLASPGAWLFKGVIKGFEKFSNEVGSNKELLFQKDIDGLRVEGDDVLIIELEKKVSNFLHLLTLNFVVPLPLEIAQKANLEREIIGTGPFVLEKMSNEEIVFKKNNSYSHGTYPSVGDRAAHTFGLLNDSQKKIPFIGQIKYFVVESDELRWKKFLNKEIDILEVPKDRLNEVVNFQGKIKKEFSDKGMVLANFPAMVNRWLSFNMNDPIVGKNKNIRKAIALAIDSQQYNNKVKEGSALVANSIFTPGIEGYDPSHKLAGYNYSLDESKSILKKEGYGPSNPLQLTYSTRSKGEDAQREANFLKEALSQIGVELKINYLDFSEFLNKGRKGELQFFTDNWIYDYPDPLNMLQLLLSKNHPGINKSGYSNSEFDSLYAEYEKMNDPELLKKMEGIVLNDYVWVMLCYERDVIIYHEGLKNFRKSSFIKNFTKYLKVD